MLADDRLFQRRQLATWVKGMWSRRLSAGGRQYSKGKVPNSITYHVAFLYLCAINCTTQEQAGLNEKLKLWPCEVALEGFQWRPLPALPTSLPSKLMRQSIARRTWCNKARCQYGPCAFREIVLCPVKCINFKLTWGVSL